MRAVPQGTRRRPPAQDQAAAGRGGGRPPACSADTTATPARSSSTTSIRPESRSDSECAESPARWSAAATRHASAYCSVGTVTRRSRLASPPSLSSYYWSRRAPSRGSSRSGVAQSAERRPVKAKVVGSSPTPGAATNARRARAFAVLHQATGTANAPPLGEALHRRASVRGQFETGPSAMTIADEPLSPLDAVHGRANVEPDPNPVGRFAVSDCCDAPSTARPGISS